MSDDLARYAVPVIFMVYGEDRQDAVEYVENALDSTEVIFEDGVIGFEVIDDEVELYE